MDPFAKLRSIARDALKSSAKEAIIPVGQELFVFDRWCITPQDDEWAVLNEDKRIFSSKRVALAWCLFSHAGDKHNASVLAETDQRLREKRFDLKMWNRVMEDADKDRRVNAALRAEHTLEEVDRLLDDLDNVVCSAKYKQAEGVN